jgi:uncharacterized protein YeaO (DUF488 family)
MPDARARAKRNIRLGRIYDPPSDSDGRRILATRYWPRGVSKSAADEYHSKLAPSRELIKEHRRGGLRWEEFGRRYKEELMTEALQKELRRLSRMAQLRVITLLCYCELEGDCHRTLLKEAIIDSVSDLVD